jgi:shikimate kinase
MNIILIGFMGSGKTAVGQQLAQQLNLDYLDCDQLIEQTAKMSISDIFAKKGEPYFRDLETEVIETLQDYDGFVLSTGGGMVMRPENVAGLKQIGRLVLLWAEPAVIYQRIKRETHRPLLKVADPKAEISRILAERAPAYKKVADHIVDTTNLNITETVEEIKQWLGSK